jgi:hypothetical protein
MIGSVGNSLAARAYAVDFASLKRGREAAGPAADATLPTGQQAAGTPSDAQKPADRAGKSANPNQLTPEQEQVVAKLKQREAEVKAHEAAHKAAAGPYASAPSYTYTTGPDGRQYITGGEVQIDMSAIQGDAEATVRKMEQIKRAALAPADPSSADRAAAAQADAIKLQAQSQEKEEREAKEEEMDGPTQPTQVTRSDSSNPNESPLEGTPAERSRASKAYSQITQIIGSATAAGMIA